MNEIAHIEEMLWVLVDFDRKRFYNGIRIFKKHLYKYGPQEDNSCIDDRPRFVLFHQNGWDPIPRYLSTRSNRQIHDRCEYILHPGTFTFLHLLFKRICRRQAAGSQDGERVGIDWLMLGRFYLFEKLLSCFRHRCHSAVYEEQLP